MKERMEKQVKSTKGSGSLKNKQKQANHQLILQRKRGAITNIQDEKLQVGNNHDTKEKKFFKSLTSTFAQAYAMKFENLEEMDNFLGKYPVPCTQTDSGRDRKCRQFLQKQKKSSQPPVITASGPDHHAGEFYQTFRDQIILILHKLSETERSHK